MMGSWFWLWLVFLFIFLLPPIGYGWGYRRWGRRIRGTSSDAARSARPLPEVPPRLITTPGGGAATSCR